jgi:hypothetical protein
MINLPVKYNQALEAEALSFAKNWIAEHCEPRGAFHSETKRLFGTPLMKRWAQIHPFGADDIVYLAENGSPEADRALRDVIAERTDRGEPLGAVLGAYNIRVLHGIKTTKPGPAKTDNFVRDIAVVTLVEQLQKQFRLSIHKNPGSTRPTATSIAAEALTGAGIGIVFSHKAVAKIWNRYHPILSGNRPPGYLGPFG